MKKNFVFRKLSPELEEVLMEELHTLKGGNGGGSDGSKWDGDLKEVEIVGEAPPPDPPAIGDGDNYPDPEPEEDPDFDPYEDGNWGGGGDQGDDPNDEENPCNKVDKAANAKTTALAKQTSVQSQIAALNPNTTIEQAFSIRKSNKTYSTSPIQNLGATGGGIINYSNSVASFHTHPSSNAPSAQDIIGLGYMRSINSGFETSYVKTADGDMYAITISDSAAAQSFYNSFKGAVNSVNEWDTNSSIGKDFARVRDSYVNSGKSVEEAYDHATAYVLNNSGITLLKAPNGSNDFTKIGTTKNVDENGVESFSNSDCPR